MTELKSALKDFDADTTIRIKAGERDWTLKLVRGADLIDGKIALVLVAGDRDLNRTHVG